MAKIMKSKIATLSQECRQNDASMTIKLVGEEQSPVELTVENGHVEQKMKSLEVEPERLAALDELVAQAQELDMGY